MGSCSLLVPTWQHTVTLFFVLMAILMALVMTQETTTQEMEVHSITPMRAVVAFVKGKPKMVSNSSQTEDETYISPTEKPVLITGLILAVAAACSAVLAIIVLVIIIVVAIKCYWGRPSKAPPYDPSYGSMVEDQGYMPVFVDRKMAQSAQMFFYQFQKQQLLAQENEQKSRHSADSDTCSESDTKDGHVPMVSCPGLAMQKNGEDLEVRNPMFFEDVPTWNGSVATDNEDSPRTWSSQGMTQEETDEKGDEIPPIDTTTTEPPSSSPPQRSSSSSVFPHPPPSSPEATMPSLHEGEGSIEPDVKTMDINKNLTQVIPDVEAKSKDASGK